MMPRVALSCFQDLAMEELAWKIPSAYVAASEDMEGQGLCRTLYDSLFQVYTNPDVIGWSLAAL